MRLAISALSLGLPLVAGLAFEGAVGFGSIATGGTEAYVVSSLADSGTGTLRDATSVSGRNITFSVSGYIVLESPLSISSHTTINGQTAPSPGIGVMGREVSASSQSNVIVRNLRIRQGTLDPDTGKSAFNMGDASNVILDHVSVEYGVWDSVDAVGAVNITVSNSIIALPIGQQFGAHLETGPVTWYRNLWVCGHNRQPLTKGPPTLQRIQAPFYINVYANGNFLDSNNNGVLDGTASNTVGSAIVLSAPWNSGSAALAGLTAQQAYASVIASAGASPRDSVDAYVVSLVESLGTKGQIITNQTSTGLPNNGYGTL
uniref:Polysaccharide lyase family 1 protein n=1 Tax=Mycena chlorophos TaxID=658473 RepID=A0ABQ0M2N3_MYCCL|nr:predicted protein [Mycena chlorophos]